MTSPAALLLRSFAPVLMLGGRGFFSHSDDRLRANGACPDTPSGRAEDCLGSWLHYLDALATRPKKCRNVSM